MWKKIKAIQGNPTPRLPILLLDQQGVRHTDAASMSNLQAEAFAGNSSDANYNPAFFELISSPDNSYQEDPTQTPDEDLMNSPFSLEELQSVLAESRNSAPGPDNIPNSFVKNPPEPALQYLLRLFNVIWLSQTFLDQWREAYVIGIPKHHKDHTHPSNYRPISLTCNLCKILEKNGVQTAPVETRQPSILLGFSKWF